MEHIVNLHIEKLPEGVYLATSDEVRGSSPVAARSRKPSRSRAMSRRS